MRKEDAAHAKFRRGIGPGTAWPGARWASINRMGVRESELLRHIAERSPLKALGPGVVVGPGDDCAVLAPSGRDLLVTVDHLVEGRHFAVGTPIDAIARKAVARSVSDIAAMAGTPAWGLATGAIFSKA